MTRLAILTPSPRCRVLDTGTDAPLDRITHIMPELPLDHDKRDSFVRHLDRVSVSQLVGGDRRLTPAPAAAACNCLRAAAS